VERVRRVDLGIVTAARAVPTRRLAADAELIKLFLTGRLATNSPTVSPLIDSPRIACESVRLVHASRLRPCATRPS